VSAKTIYNKLKAWDIDVDSRPSKTSVALTSRVSGWSVPGHAVPYPG
jgi:hypothetical protein